MLDRFRSDFQMRRGLGIALAVGNQPQTDSSRSLNLTMDSNYSGLRTNMSIRPMASPVTVNNMARVSGESLSRSFGDQKVRAHHRNGQ
jgi:hypothetical protein